MEAFELRLWDGRIGRWLTIDPYHQHHSPYLGMGNNPISRIDPDGGTDIDGDDWYKNIATGKIEWIEGSAPVEGYEHLGFDFSHRDVNGNLIEWGLGLTKTYCDLVHGIQFLGAPKTDKKSEELQNYGLMMKWILGTDDVINFDEFDSRTQAFVNFIGVRLKVEEFKKTGKILDNIWNFSPTDNPNFINDFGIRDPFNIMQSNFAHADALLNSPARLFTGSFKVSVSFIDSGLIKVTVTNTTSLSSGSARILENKTKGKFKNQVQNYSWIERY